MHRRSVCNLYYLKAVRVQYNYCIVLRILTIKPTYFLLSLSIFRALYAYGYMY